jgi:glycerol-3-phosphate O-acyltransferase/dihydroxyacetone phosphate acyltransferase
LLQCQCLVAPTAIAVPGTPSIHNPLVMISGYGLVRTLARWLVSLFYRRVEVAGLEHVPATGPLIVAATHQNALVDPMLLLALVPRRMVPLAKEPLFRHPLIGPFLRLVGALPVLRRQEGNLDPTRNRAMFAATSAHLGRGHAVLIFPEGLSQPEPALMPLRTGAARMLLEAEAAAGRGLGVTLVPVGLVFHEPGTFRAGRAFLRIGEPVATGDCVELHATQPEAAVQRLTDRLTAALRRQIVEAEDRETLRLLRALEAMARVEAAPDRPDGAARAEWMQGAMRAYRYLRDQEAWRVARFRDEVDRYLTDLEEAGLSDRGLAQPYTARVVTRYVAREAVSLLLALPLLAWGIATHVLPYELTALAVGRLRPQPDEEATYKIVAAAVLYPLGWLAEAWVAWRVGGGALLTLFALLLVPSAFIAIAWRDRLVRVRRDARGFVRLLLDRDLRRRLASRRQALVDELAALIRLVPQDILSPGTATGGSDIVRDG